MTTQTNDNERSFVAKDTTKIGFGKLKGQPHSDLLLMKNEGYRAWILDQGPNFKFYGTYNYLKNSPPRLGMTCTVVKQDELNVDTSFADKNLEPTLEPTK